jgi:hypothetical protein
LQVHCSIEAGAVVLGCKGQPMGIAFSERQPIVLFGSEASALQVAVTADGRPLTTRLNMDEVGETIRVGPPAALVEGGYSASLRAPAAPTTLLMSDGQLELRAYSLSGASEPSRAQLQARCVPIGESTPPFDPRADLVAIDLRQTPQVLHAIDGDWADPDSTNRAAASNLGDFLLGRMEARRSARLDTVDLLVCVVLWLSPPPSCCTLC